MQPHKLALVVLAMAVSIGANANTSVGNHVAWDMSTQGSPDEFRHLTTQDNMGGIVFIRPAQNNERAAQSSTNLAINDRYLISLQDGHYASGAACAGEVRLSAVPTGIKINDLSAEPVNTHLAPHEVQYFVVETQPNYQAQLTRVSASQAASLIQGTARQSHQISRVNPTACQPIRTAPAPIRTAPTPVVSYQEPQRVEPQEVVKTPQLNLVIHFDHDKSHVKSNLKGEVSNAAQFLHQYPATNARIEGHTDAVGDAKYNQQLSERRAQAVKQLLVKQHNVNAERLAVVGYGESRPVADNKSQAGRYANRRVVITAPSNH